MQFELAAIYQHAPIGLAVIDRQLRFARVNERLAEMNGLPIAAHLGRSVAEVLPSLAQQAQAVLNQVLSTGEPLLDVEVRGETPAQPGVQRTWLEQFSPIRNDTGAVVGVSVAVLEITDQRRVEAQLQKSEQRLSVALEAADLVTWEWDVAADRSSSDSQSWLGYAPAELPASLAEWLPLIHPDDRARVQACLSNHLAGKSANYECEYRMRAPDDSWRWVTSRGKATRRDAQGRALAMTGVRRDITAQKLALARSEQALRLSQERLALALEAAHMGVWQWVAGGDHLVWSPRMFALCGLPPSPDGRQDLAKFLAVVHEQDRPVVEDQLATAMGDGGPYQAEFRVWRPQGGERWLLARGRVVKGPSDDQVLLGVTLDLTEHKAMEHALRDAEARRNEFLATLGHELRNPLAPIANAVQLLELTGDQPAKRAASLQILRRQTQHLARLVDDLLEVSRITQGRIELRVEPVQLAAAASAAIEVALPLARAKSQSVRVDIPATLHLMADPARLTQIISNLVVNAAKYTPEGGHVAVSASERDPGGIELVVSDDGAGISEDLRPRIFELFAQDPRTLDRSEGGLGIGLALAQRLAQLHGGSIRCDSAGPGQGATFTLSLPRSGPPEEVTGQLPADAAG